MMKVLNSDAPARYSDCAYTAVPCMPCACRLLLVISLAMPVSMAGQETGTTGIITSIAEELASDEGQASLYIDRLNDLADDPVNLNSADEEELARLFFLSAFQVKALADYSHSSGIIQSVYEIAAIPGFDRESAEMLVPFISLRDFKAAGKSTARIQNSLLSTFSFKPGNKDTTYIGSQLKALTRYRFSAGSVSGGITAEKDAGEKFLSGTPALPDFLSAYLAYTGKQFVRKIVIGDFSTRFGLGTNVNTGMSMGYSLASQGYMPARNEIRQYTSTDENSFFRGAAASFALNQITLHIYLSSNLVDATTLPDGRGGQCIQSLYTAGIHNTKGLAEKKDILSDISSGFNISFNSRSIKAGFAWTKERFSIPLTKEAYDPEELYDFKGTCSNVYSLYYSSLVNRFLLYGEVSLDGSYDYAIVQGFSVRLSDRLSLNSHYRNFRPGFFSFHGKGTGTSGWNEKSILAGFTLEAAKHAFISGGCEVRKYPWLRFGVSSPSMDFRQEIRVRYLPSDRVSMECLINYRYTVNDSAESFGIPMLEETRAGYARASARYSPSENFSLTTRADYKVVNNGEKGILLSQDASFRCRKIPLSIWIRYCMFSTDGWYSRLYTYENDLLYSFSIPALSGKGSRSYFMIKYEIGKFAELRFKYGITSIIACSDPGNREEFRFQAGLKF